MGLLKGMRKRRLEKKAAEKAAKVKALAEVKADAKLEKRKEAYLRKTAKQVRKMDRKELKARRKHNEKMAATALEQLKEERAAGPTILKTATSARIAAPVLIPLFYRGMTLLREYTEEAPARRRPAAPFTGTGASQRVRIDQVRKSLNKGIPSGFAKDVEERMDELEKAVKNSSSMTPDQEKRVLKSVSRELDLVEAQIAAKRI